MTRMNVIGLVLAVVVALAAAVTVHAGPVVKAPVPAKQLPPVGPFPDAECNEDASMDIYVDANGALWECVCQKMFTELDCAWYEVPTESADSRKRRAKLITKAKQRLHVRALPRLVVIRL